MPVIVRQEEGREVRRRQALLVMAMVTLALPVQVGGWRPRDQMTASPSTFSRTGTR